MPKSTLSGQSGTKNLDTGEAPWIYYYLEICCNSSLNLSLAVEGSVTHRVYTDVVTELHCKPFQINFSAIFGICIVMGLIGTLVIRIE
jgi:hypothetical protein